MNTKKTRWFENPDIATVTVSILFDLFKATNSYNSKVKHDSEKNTEFTEFEVVESKIMSDNA